MSDLVFRVVEGQFSPPNIDNRQLTNANIDANASGANIGNAALLTGVTQLAKQSAIQVATKAGNRTGERSKQRDIQNTLEISGDIATLAGGAVFGPAGVISAGLIIGVQKGFKAWDIMVERERSDLEAREVAKRAGFERTYQGSGFR